MTPEVRAFVDHYAQKEATPPTIVELMLAMQKTATLEQVVKQHNHEIWRACPKCGHQEDLRKTFTCSACGTEIFKPKYL